MSTVSNSKSAKLETLLNSLVESVNTRRQEVLAYYKVTELDVEIIQYLEGHPTQKMKEIGEFFKVKLSTLTSLIDKLERLKLVRRKHSKEDRRVIFLHSTPKGQRLITKLDDVTHEVAEKVSGIMQNGQFEALSGGMEAMLETLDNMKIGDQA